MSGIAQLRHGQPGDSFRGWLWAITRYKIQDHFRLQGREPKPAGGEDGHDRLQKIPDPAAFEISDLTGPPPDAGERAGIVQRALEQLRPSFEGHIWQAFWQMTQGERTATEIGAELGMSPEAVRQAKFRVLKRLREELEGLLD
jgi:RNA polymerase sigma-70 factor (ECF subfamily)